MATGVVKFFNYKKGFGFITPTDGSKDIFVHSSGTKGSIKKDDNVTYTVKETPRGLTAVNVSVKKKKSVNIIRFVVTSILRFLPKFSSRGRKS